MTTADVERKCLQVSLVDLSGETTVRYTPLGAMYLRAALESEPDLADRIATTIHTFLAGTSLATMTEQIVEASPDLIGFSCQGWNVAVYRQLIPTIRQLLPDAVIVLGGNHVSHQGDRWLSQVPEADLVVNGEGEQTIKQLAHWLMTGTPPLHEIAGITYRDEGKPATTTERPRATSFEEIASPYLDPSQELVNADVVLWETNRGCPYHCSFCFWGGAVGQKLNRAELARLHDELVTIAQAGVPAIFLCDANFGILPRDVEIAAMVVEVREKYGTPHTLHVNWAKNHAARVGEILDVLRDGGVSTNVYLALQTLSRPALALAGRDERGRPEMFELARRIVDAGGDIGAELIFGLPGETLHDFQNAYDQLYLQFPRLLLHPLWVLPNTTYDTDRDQFGLVTLRPDPTVDYEGILEHNTLPRKDNQEGLALLLADEILTGTGYARTTMRGLAVWAGLRPTRMLHEFRAFLPLRTDPLSQNLSATFSYVDAECYFHRHVRGTIRSALFHDRSQAATLLAEFVDAVVKDPAARAACQQLVRYDTALLPRTDIDGVEPVDETLLATFDVYAASGDLLCNALQTPVPANLEVAIRIRHPAGFARHSSDAIDLAGQWRGRVIDVSPAPLSRSLQS
ncbi:cobalamin-dependent protein [Nocardia sp. NBC_01730]|uniref:B12-binding domain-containing radical SAM protein n=1 Tax=Nocardia sp. NBC_01730 TaxID=2975998 RepID=UPI002E14AACB|nr:cobalamin-dependent protein [Nocardia sp. NBC_01730]WSG60853.1 cobalamin-dependent protein [Nocardia sp. NBC_01730]